jgi:hypothetical protein
LTGTDQGLPCVATRTLCGTARLLVVHIELTKDRTVLTLLTFELLILTITPDRLLAALAEDDQPISALELLETILGVKRPPVAEPLLGRPLVMVAQVSQPTSAVTVFGTPLGVEFLAMVLLLLFSILMALVVGSLFKLGLKAPWKDTLLAAGAVLGGTFFIGFAITNYLMPSVTG